MTGRAQSSLSRTLKTMPADHPDTPDQGVVANIASYILSMNGVPAGPNRVDRRPSVLRTVKIISAP
jgi:hypothetical protein